MLKYIRELIQPISKKNSSSTGSNQTFTVSFKKNEKSLIYQGAVEGISYNNQTNKSEEKDYFQWCNDKISGTTTLLVDKMLTTYRYLVPGMRHTENLKNVSDLRTCEEFQKLQNNTVDDLQPQPRCHEVPRQFVFGDSVNNKRIVSSYKKLAEQTPKKLNVSKENERDMQRMIRNLNIQRDLRKAKKNLETSPDEMVNQFLSESAAVSEQNEKHKVDVNKLLNDMLRAREKAIKESEKNKVQENRSGLISMDNIVEYEEMMRGRKMRYNNTKTTTEEKMKLFEMNPKGHFDADPRGKNYLNNFLEINRIIESKIMQSKDKRAEITPKPDNVNQSNVNPTVKTNVNPAVKTNVNPIKIGNIQVLKLKSDTNKEHAIGITGYKAHENIKEQK